MLTLLIFLISVICESTGVPSVFDVPAVPVVFCLVGATIDLGVTSVHGVPAVPIDLALTGVSSVAVADIPAISGVAAAAGGLVVISSPAVDGGSSVAGSPVMAFTAGFSAFVGYLLLLVSLQLPFIVHNSLNMRAVWAYANRGMFLFHISSILIRAALYYCMYLSSAAILCVRKRKDA